MQIFVRISYQNKKRLTNIAPKYEKVQGIPILISDKPIFPHLLERCVKPDKFIGVG